MGGIVATGLRHHGVPRVMGELPEQSSGWLTELAIDHQLSLPQVAIVQCCEKGRSLGPIRLEKTIVDRFVDLLAMAGGFDGPQLGSICDLFSLRTGLVLAGILCLTFG